MNVAAATPEYICTRIAGELATVGWSVCADFLPPEQIAALAGELRARWVQGEFHQAGVGSGANPHLRQDIRNDRVYWLDDAAQTAAQSPYFIALESLRLALNRQLFLGLFSFEGHMAAYPPGSFYARHLDQFQGVAHRKVSVVLYLNNDWQADDGGQLRLYLQENNAEKYIDVLPCGGTLACFLSDRFYHEVLSATRERLSVTGWFRVRV
ncbi:MAG: 2OG-Fe(II) oxygenase [Gammaproteobacteria bacterium]|nr:2OG-Fe(II) oxygenase [Gammaproteobacteria bacterium]MBI5460772.1 2OG-Fe(II) oxygenase [Gammaproteobacteria bacterium]